MSCKRFARAVFHEGYLQTTFGYGTKDFWAEFSVKSRYGTAAEGESSVTFTSIVLRDETHIIKTKLGSGLELARLLEASGANAPEAYAMLKNERQTGIAAGLGPSPRKRVRFLEEQED